MIRRPPRSTLDRSSAASDVYKRQRYEGAYAATTVTVMGDRKGFVWNEPPSNNRIDEPVSYTHLRAHETVLDLVCRLLLEKKNTIKINTKNTD